jgi:acetyl-CoA synthetase (ADP-forming)
MKNMSSRPSSIANRFIATGQKFLLEHDAEKLAREYGIPVVKSKLARSEREAVSIARKLGYPVVLKVVSPDVLHKTDVGGVVLNVRSQAGVRQAYRNIMKNILQSNKSANIVGVIVQKMTNGGQEFVVGATRDPQFGPTVMFGLGGTYVELFKDVSFRLAPVSEEESLRMIRELKSHPLFSGYRGSRPLDISSTSRVIMKVGAMITENEWIESIDINPLMVLPKRVVATDVRVILKQK